ncbi:hypothetical protein MSPP1_002936 [Malassezia sp. CBS 17886]|nr:hypothetical protein MSPP1_002936 [Malassezia sp. CBS 17886]
MLRGLLRDGLLPAPPLCGVRTVPVRVSRAFASSARAHEGEPPSAASPHYPFARNVITRGLPPIRADGLRTPPPESKYPSRGVMRRVDAGLCEELDPADEIARLFSRRSPDCIPPGSIVQVESYLTPTRTNTTTFAGVMIAVKRAGVATSFVLRAIAHKLGVEVRFHAYSPMIKQIRVIQRAEARKGKRGLQRTRRAKLYYMRRRDDRRVNSVAGVMKQFRLAEQQREQRASPSSRHK